MVDKHHNDFNKPLKQKNRILDQDKIPQFQDAYDQELNFSFDDFPLTDSFAIQKLDNFIDSSIQNYKELRDIPSLSASIIGTPVFPSHHFTKDASSSLHGM